MPGEEKEITSKRESMRREDLGNLKDLESSHSKSEVWETVLN